MDICDDREASLLKTVRLFSRLAKTLTVLTSYFSKEIIQIAIDECLGIFLNKTSWSKQAYFTEIIYDTALK